MTVYPIQPSSRIQERIRLVLQNNLSPLSAFSGAVFVNNRTTQEETIPWVCVRIISTEEMPPQSNYYRLQVTIQTCEDRMEQDDSITGHADTRPRFDHRYENITALLHGVWDGTSFISKVNAISTVPGAAVLKMYDSNFSIDVDGEDRILTEHSFTLLCVSTEQ